MSSRHRKKYYRRHATLTPSEYISPSEQKWRNWYCRKPLKRFIARFPTYRHEPYEKNNHTRYLRLQSRINPEKKLFISINAISVIWWIEISHREIVRGHCYELSKALDQISQARYYDQSREMVHREDSMSGSTYWLLMEQQQEREEEERESQ